MKNKFKQLIPNHLKQEQRKPIIALKFKKEYQNNHKYPSCLDCGTKIAHRSTRCPSCAAKHANLKNRKVSTRPEINELLEMIKQTSYVAVGQKYGVSDNTIRKWIKVGQSSPK